MSELQTLTDQRDEILAKIREIEASCEGIENENNAKRVQELNLEQAKITAQKNEVAANLSDLQSKLTAIGSEISKLSGTGVDRILEAIKKQRWYFIKNKTKVIFDRNTGNLWANLNYFPWTPNIQNSNEHYGLNSAKEAVRGFDGDGFSDWVIPRFDDFKEMIADRTFPFQEGPNYYIKNECYWFCDMTGYGSDGIDLNDLTIESGVYRVIPCSKILVDNSDYVNNISLNNPVYTEKERLQFTLDLFVQNELWPIFDDDEITQLYKKIYFEKPALLEQLQSLQEQIESLQNVTLLSSEFDYTALLSKYDISTIDNSIIKYYKAIQEWIDELIEKFDYYQQETFDTLTEYNEISKGVSQNYKVNEYLSDKENDVLVKRTEYFQMHFSLDMNDVRNQLLSFKIKADDLESRIYRINRSGNVLSGLAEIEKESRPGFGFIAENTSNILKETLKKIEYFECDKEYVINVIKLYEEWNENFIILKKNVIPEFISDCHEKNIGNDSIKRITDLWTSVRLKTEETFIPLVDRCYKYDIPLYETYNISMAEKVLSVLNDYIIDLNNYFITGILDKVLYFTTINDEETLKLSAYMGIIGQIIDITQKMQLSVQNIIFNCKDLDDRVFIIDVIKPITDVILDCIIDSLDNNTNVFKDKKYELLKLKNSSLKTYLGDNQEFSSALVDYNKIINTVITDTASIAIELEEDTDEE